MIDADFQTRLVAAEAYYRATGSCADIDQLVCAPGLTQRQVAEALLSYATTAIDLEQDAGIMAVLEGAAERDGFDVTKHLLHIAIRIVRGNRAADTSHGANYSKSMQAPEIIGS